MIIIKSCTTLDSLQVMLYMFFQVRGLRFLPKEKVRGLGYFFLVTCNTYNTKSKKIISNQA